MLYIKFILAPKGAGADYWHPIHGKSKINLGTSSGKILLNDHWRILYKGLE
jgi:hypothetical protein